MCYVYAGMYMLQVANKVVTMFAQQIFHTGFVHADPHPGNILVRPLPKGQGAEIVLLDHGLYMPIEKRYMLMSCTCCVHVGIYKYMCSTKESLCRIWKSIILGEVKTLERESLKLGVQSESSILSLVSFMGIPRL